MAIGDITREDVLMAIRWINENGEPPGWESSKYTLVTDGREYSPKYILARAHSYVTGSELAPGAFKSARHARTVLRGLGFEVREKGRSPPSKNVGIPSHCKGSRGTGKPDWDYKTFFAVGQPAQGVVVDGNNVAYYENGHGPVDIHQLILVFSQLKAVYGFNDVRIVVKASLRHEVGPREYDRMLAKLNKASKGRAGHVFHEVPKGGDDDLTVIRFAIDNDYVILSNDRFNDHIERHPEYAQSLAGRLLKFTIDGGRLHIASIDARRRMTLEGDEHD